MARPAWDVKQARETAGLRQTALSLSLGQDKRYIDRVERSLLAMSSTSAADALITALPGMSNRAQFDLRSLKRRKQSHRLGLRFDGNNLSSISTPNTALLSSISATQDLDVRWRFAPDAYANAQTQGIFGKRNADLSLASWRVAIGTTPTSKMDLTWWSGATPLNSSFNLPAGYVDRAMVFGRFTLDVDDGAGHSVTTFYTSINGVDWVSAGVDTKNGTTSIDATAASLIIGGGSTIGLAGVVEFVEVRAGIGGAVVARFDGTNGSPTGPLVPATANVEPINLLTLNEYGVESSLPALFTGESATGTTTWDATTGYEGTHSVLLTAATPNAGRASFDVHPAGPPAGYFTVVPAQPYTFVGHVKGLVATKACNVKINWSNAAGQFVTSNSGAQITNSLAAWTTLVVNANAPTGAVRAAPGCDMRGSVNGDASNWDGFAFYSGTELEARAPGDVWTMAGSGWSWVEAA